MTAKIVFHDTRQPIPAHQLGYQPSAYYPLDYAPIIAGHTPRTPGQLWERLLESNDVLREYGTSVVNRPAYTLRLAQAFNRAIARASERIDYRIARWVITELWRAGTPATHVWDGDEDTTVSMTIASLSEVMDLLHDLDEAWVYTRGGDGVRFTFEGRWDNALTDYTIGLDPVILPILDKLDTLD